MGDTKFSHFLFYGQNPKVFIHSFGKLVLFVFQFYAVCNFGKFVNFGLSTVRRERINSRKNTL